MGGLIYFLLVGILSGWLAGKVWQGAGFGLVGNIIVGIIGGLVGGFLAGIIGISADSLIAKILVSAAGAWLLLFILAKLKK